MDMLNISEHDWDMMWKEIREWLSVESVSLEVFRALVEIKNKYENSDSARKDYLEKHPELMS
jgi:hypothetical protein